MSDETQFEEKQRLRVGYALPLKKVSTFIKPSLITYTKQHGIDLIQIDPEKPLIEQSPFDVIIHKLYGQDWIRQLQHFSSQNPTVPIIDSPHSIEKIHNRITMLEVVTQLKQKFNFGKEKLDVPKQIVVSNAEDLTIQDTGLTFPVLAKPSSADGSANAHQMYLIFDGSGFEALITPIVLQEFVNHGGVIFKVYVAGSSVKCVKRRSLPDITEEKMKSLKGSMSFSQISNLAESDEKGDVNYLDEDSLERIEMPGESFVAELAQGLREAMGLNLFNFDVIRDGRDGDRYLVIDINYFPGFSKMPDYESVLTGFFWDLVKNKKKKLVVTNGEDDDQ